MIGFPIDDLLSAEGCYKYLKRSLHPEGLSCPNGHELPSDQAPHDRRRTPIVDYRCWECGAVFNIFTDTVWSKTHYDPSTIVMPLRGFAKGMPTKWLTDEMDLAYPSVLDRRHRIQRAVQEGERQNKIGLIFLEPSITLYGGITEPLRTLARLGRLQAGATYGNASGVLGALF
jgi:transposase-like protein